MKNIELIENFDFNEKIEPGMKVRELLNSSRRRILEIKLGDNAVLKRHQAAEPITVLCLKGTGIFRAGENLEEELPLQPGTFLTLEPGIPHEAQAAPELHILVTRFKEN